MGFTFIMDANISKYFYNYIMGYNGNEANSNKPLKNFKNLELRHYFYLFLILKNIFVHFYFISIKASIRNVQYCPSLTQMSAVVPDSSFEFNDVQYLSSLLQTNNSYAIFSRLVATELVILSFRKLQVNFYMLLIRKEAIFCKNLR